MHVQMKTMRVNCSNYSRSERGPLAGPGDYTNYTEDDIKEIARILTGWIDLGYRGQLLQQPGSTFCNIPA